MTVARPTTDKIIQTGDQVLIMQQKTTMNPTFDPTPYDVTEVKGSQVTARRGDKVKTRNMAKVKLIKKRPEHLMPRQLKGGKQFKEQEEEDEDFTLDPR